MRTVVEPIMNEFRDEVVITKRVLERIPGDKLAWKPHAKSMSLGQLGWHVATVPGGLARLLQQDSFDVANANFAPPQPASRDEILGAYEQNVRDAESFLTGLTDQQAQANWSLLRKDAEVFTKPRIAVLRTIMLNHWYHHRGQLSVYLRLLDVPVPVIYGRSADEDPFS